MTTIVDTFDRADSASALGTTSDGSATWTAPQGTWGISSNQAYASALVSSAAIAVLDLGTGDATLSLDITGMGVCFRYVDNSNFWIAGKNALFKVVGGSFNNMGSYSIPATVQVVLAGGVVTVKDGSGTVLTTVTDSFQSTATKHGLYTGSTADRGNNFQAVFGPAPARPGAHGTVHSRAVIRAAVI